MLLNHVSAINIPTPSFDLLSSNADSLNASDFDSPISNFTSLGTIDPAFSVVPVFQGGKLRPVPCLLNSVNVALQLALEDFEGPMFATVFTLDSHPQVEIRVMPEEEGGSIPRKYAVWGLNTGIGTSFPIPSIFILVPCSTAHRISLLQSAILNPSSQRINDRNPQLPNRDFHTLISRGHSRPYHIHPNWSA